ncbi:Thymidine phosphorylase [Channa argus]|uniref:Thymidine phosphorylase n=1 Tax=Channa argus TaxID=215402 RepID=A0A6G1QRS7_CHAAH|nr:Thymidine phosphorylase [Channa argus]
MVVGAVLLLMTGQASDLSEGRKHISEAVASRRALSKFQAMMEAQGVAAETARALCSPDTDYYSILHKSAHQTELQTPEDGVVLDVDGLVLAGVLQKLGAGRSKVGEAVNHSVGAEMLVSLGQRVRKGEMMMMMMMMMIAGVPWLRLHYEDPAPTLDQINQLQKALVLGTNESTETQQKHTLIISTLLLLKIKVLNLVEELQLRGNCVSKASGARSEKSKTDEMILEHSITYNYCM